MEESRFNLACAKQGGGGRHTICHAKTRDTIIDVF